MQELQRSSIGYSLNWKSINSEIQNKLFLPIYDIFPLSWKVSTFKIYFTLGWQLRCSIIDCFKSSLTRILYAEVLRRFYFQISQIRGKSGLSVSLAPSRKMSAKTQDIQKLNPLVKVRKIPFFIHPFFPRVFDPGNCATGGVT